MEGEVMDPQLKSVLTSILTLGAGGVVSWAVTKGLVTSDQSSAVTQDLVGLAGALISGGLVWWKARDQSPRALIDKINKPKNGLKVVAASIPESVAPTVTAPIKGGQNG
jgi:hypothetical protein